MASAAQIRANRANAARSTGPITEPGKQRSATNSLTHGFFAASAVLPGESPQEFAELRYGLIDSHLPQNVAELLLVERMAVAQWKLRRIQASDAVLHRCLKESFTGPYRKFVEKGFGSLTPTEQNCVIPMTKKQAIAHLERLDSPDHPAMQSSMLYLTKPQEMEALSRLEQRLENSLFRGLRELQRLKKQRGSRGDEIDSPYQMKPPAEQEGPSETMDENVRNEANLDTDEDKCSTQPKLAREGAMSVRDNPDTECRISAATSGKSQSEASADAPGKHSNAI